MNKRKRNQKGFTLIELLIVVAIILVIAAIAIPNMITSREAANEASAASNLKQLVNAQAGYRQLAGVWAPDTIHLGGGANCPNQPDTASPPAYSCLLPTEVATAMNAGATPLSGYTFTYIPGDPSGWAETATPATTDAGRKSFFVDATGVVRYVKGTGGATVAGIPLGQ
jgi:type IV pilus assembly protein PilA